MPKHADQTTATRQPQRHLRLCEPRLSQESGRQRADAGPAATRRLPLVPEPDGADFVVVNTCGFIERARDESFAAIDEMLELKERGRIRGVIVSGCLAERQKEQLLADRPEIDPLVGVFGREEVTHVADRLVGRLDEQRTVFQPAPIRPLPDTDRLRITPRHFAYLKISEGCDRLCTFCAIPKMRGKHATKPIEEVVRRGRAAGRRRRSRTDHRRPGHDRITAWICTASRGWPSCCGELEQVDGIDWIRLMYFYPDVHRRRADRRDRGVARRSSPTSTCRCSTSTTTCSGAWRAA